MEYAITILTTLIFVLLYSLTRPKNREHFTKSLCDEDFSAIMKKIAENEGLPSKTGKKEYSVTKFVRTINLINFTTKRYIKQNLKQRIFIPALYDFSNLIDENNRFLKKLSKLDFSKLDDLLTLDNAIRIEKICRTLLDAHKYQLSEENISLSFEIFNAVNTITFPEMQNFHLIAKYLLLEKLYYVSIRVKNLIRIGRYAKRVTSYPKLYLHSKFYNQVKTNNIFLYFTSKFQKQECPSCDLVFFDVVDNISNTTKNIFNQLKFVDFYDFLEFYTPLHFLQKFNAFADSTPEVKENFLTELSRQSTKQNIDELAYTFSLIKYFDREDNLFFKANRSFLFNRFLNISSFKSNMKTLSIALKSRLAMNLIFGKSTKILSRE